MWKEASFFFLPSVIYFRNPLSKCDSVRRLPSTLPSLERSLNLISLKTVSVLYFWNHFSKCDSVRRLPSTLRRLTISSLEISFSENPKWYIFLKSSQHLWHIERVLKFFREVGLTKLCDWVLLGVFSVLRSFRLFLDGFSWVFGSYKPGLGVLSCFLMFS